MTAVVADQPNNLHRSSLTCFSLDFASPEGLGTASDVSRKIQPPTCGWLCAIIRRVAALCLFKRRAGLRNRLLKLVGEVQYVLSCWLGCLVVVMECELRRRSIQCEVEWPRTSGVVDFAIVHVRERLRVFTLFFRAFSDVSKQHGDDGTIGTLYFVCLRVVRRCDCIPNIQNLAVFCCILLQNCRLLSDKTSLGALYLKTQCDANALVTLRPVVSFSATPFVSLLSR